jgi:hypothetical protein
MATDGNRCFLEVFDIDQITTAKLLLGLGEWSGGERCSHIGSSDNLREMTKMRAATTHLCAYNFSPLVVQGVQSDNTPLKALDNGALNAIPLWTPHDLSLMSLKCAFADLFSFM